MGNSSVSRPINAQVPNDIADMIERRAGARSVKPARYVVLLLEWWKSQGYPAIDTVDSTARAMVMQDMLHARVDPTLNEPLPGEDTAGRLPGRDKRSSKPRKNAA